MAYGPKLAAPCSAVLETALPTPHAAPCSAVLEALERSPSADVARRTMQLRINAAGAAELVLTSAEKFLR